MTVKTFKKTKPLLVLVTVDQMRKLDKLSQVSLKPKSVLVREAIELLFKAPGGSR